MYKITLLVLTLSFIATSCDVPRNRSSIYDSTYSDRTSASGTASNFYTSTTTTTTDTATTTPDTTTTTSTVPSEYSHCVSGTTQFPSSSTIMGGSYFICQSQTDKTKVYLWPQNSISSKICLIPMYTNGSTSINIGNAQCQYLSSTTAGVEFTLYKNRSGFENYIINAVMIMKDEAFVYPYPYTLKYGNTAIANTTAFYLCMDTAYQTPAYCQAFASIGQYQMHNF